MKSRDRWLLKIPKKEWDGIQRTEAEAGLTQRNITFLTVRGERERRLVQILAYSQSWEAVSIFEAETSKRGKEAEVWEDWRKI